jgi:hypothetical protein
MNNMEELNEFNTGNSHEINPLGGIPMGVGQNGQQNTVEEGETMKGDFIYSDRIIFTPDVVEQFNLPKSLTGKTSAEASKIINRKFEGRNDKITTSTKKSMLDKVAQAQETIKQIQAQEIAAAQQTNSTEVPDMMEGQIPQGMEEFVPQRQMELGGFTGSQSGSGGMGMGSLGQIFGSFGQGLKDNAQQKYNSKLPEGYVDKKDQQDQMNNQMIDKTKDTIAQATGPVGQVFRGVQKMGQGIGDSIGGDSGAFVSGLFSPEEGTMSAWTDGDVSFGDKMLSTIPGIGAIKANQRKEAKLAKFKLNQDTLSSQMKISDFAFGGNLLGEPTSGGPITPIKKTPPPVVVSKDNLQNLNVQPLEDNPTPSTSRNKKMINLQSGVFNDKLGHGYYYYYDKKPGDPGFDVKQHRDFVTEKNHSLGQRSRLADGTENPLYNYELNNYLSANKNFAMGGNMYAGGGPFDKSMASYDPNNINNTVQPINSAVNGLTNWFNPSSTSTTTIPNNVTAISARTFGPQGGHSTQAEIKNVTDQIGTGLNKAGEFIKDNKGALRYAPVAMNAFQLHKLNKEGYDTVNPMINNTRYNPQYMDEKSLTNQINAESNYAGNALVNASNGSMGALSNSILASQLNKTRGLSDAYSKVADVNRNENKAGQQFNLSVDEANIGRRIGAEDRTAMNKGAFKTEQSKLRGQIGTDLGEIGKEETYKDMAKKLYGYDFNGKYYVAPDGTKKTTQEMADMIDSDKYNRQQKKSQVGTAVLKGFNNKTKE